MNESNLHIVTAEMFTKAMDRIFGEFDKIKLRFGDIDKRIEGLEGRMGYLEGKITNLEDRMATKNDVSSLEEKMMCGFEAFERRLTLFETSVSRSIKTLSGQIQQLILTKADWPEEI